MDGEGVFGRGKTLPTAQTEETHSDLPAATDPAAELVRMAAGLIRLQARVRAAGADSIDMHTPASAPSPKLASNARQAAVRSGIEALRGFGVSLLGELQDGLERDAFHYVSPGR